MGIVKQSHGDVTAESKPGKGFTFTVYFPKIAEEPVSDTLISDDLTPPVPNASSSWMMEALLAVGEELLAELGYKVTSRTSSRKALVVLKNDPSRFDLVISDQTMPYITGVELAREILAIRPVLSVTSRMLILQKHPALNVFLRCP
jgi:CheY-like chemotaxis protein